VYKHLLSRGAKKAASLSMAVGLNRTTCLEYLRSLKTKGFINVTKVGGKYFYQAEDPTRFTQIIHERLFLVDKLIPFFENREQAEKPIRTEILERDAGELLIRREKRKGRIHATFGDSDNGVAVTEDTVLLFSRDSELPSIKINSASIVLLHQQLFAGIKKHRRNP